MPRPGLSDIDSAIELRRWAWSVLAGKRRVVPEATPGGLQLFLDREACATALARIPGVDLPGPVRARASLESQRILLARAELAAVARAATAAGLSLVPLKGTHALLTPDTAYTGKDVDVLARPIGAGAAERALETAGFAAASYRSYLHVVLTRPGTDLPVELHGTIWPQAALSPDDLWNAATPSGSVPGLRSLSPADHLWLSLVHVVAVHPERSGRLRDLLLIRDAAGRCAVDDMAIVSRRIEAHPSRQALTEELSLAQGQAAVDVALAADRLAAAWYALDAMVGLTPAGRPVRTRLAVWASMMVGPGAPASTVIHRLLAAGGTSRLRPVAWLEAKSPWMGRAIRVGVRLIWAVPVICLALPYVGRARRAAGAVRPA
jgi:hypothetical protein